MTPLRFAVALAAAMSSLAAGAQSHVALYGIVDLGYLYSDPASGPSTSELADGIQSQSRIGVRGVERLSPSVNAAFTLEAGIAGDTGQLQQAGRLFGRQAWASLLSRTGEVRLGRQYGIGYEYFLADTSPFGTTFRDAGTGSVFSSAAGRMILDNVAMLRTGDFGGFSGAVGYSFNANGTEQPDMSSNVGAWTAGARFRGDNLYLAVSYENFNCPDTTTETTFNTCNALKRDNQSHLQVGGSFEFSRYKLYGTWALEENQFNFFAVTPARKAQIYEIGARVRVFGGDFLAAWQGRDDEWDANLNVWALGYTHPLSRRTNLYTFVSDTTADDNPVTQLVSGGRIVREGYTPAQVTAYRERDRMQFGLGLRHSF